ncbi:MAG TPA: ATP-grasp domain-containing protein [Hyphomicrobium sp.]|nr:ATP-grasp domain-containing protein [Hyphomicrobium sp.]
MSLSGDAVLIAAFSGRSLAQSARRAGYRPFVVDAFGDLDTRDAAEDIRVIDGAMQTGFRTKPLIAALNELSQSARTTPVGLVLGSGFEDKTRLVAALASRVRLLGSDAKTIETCKNPKKFFALLDDLAILHPQTQSDPPSNPADWISKRIGGSGGRHVRDCSGRPRAKPRRYFQKRLAGERYSIGALIANEANGPSCFAVSKQWASPSAAHPYRFGGCVSNPSIDPMLLAEMTRIAHQLATALHLTGMASFDFIVERDIPYLLEVNPRPGASLDILDDSSGSLFAGHLAACTGAALSSHRPDHRPARAMAILHADRGDLVLGETPWPDWSADRGVPGTFIPAGAPLASALAEAPTADAAEALARTRLAELEDLLYGHAES